MALDQSALLELLGELKLTDVTDRIRVATETLYQELIDAEAAAFIGAAPFERTPDRTTQRNGTRPRTLTTTAGELELRIPKLRQGSFFPSLLERRRRVEQALFAVVMEAYVHGVIVSARTASTPPLRPWLYAQTTDGSRRLYFHAKLMDRATDLDDVLGRAGIEVEIGMRLPAKELRFMKWLSGYRFTRFRLPLETEDQIRAACATPRPLGVAIHGAAQELPYDLSTIRGNLYSQIWRHEVNFVDGYSDLSDTARICAA